MDYKYLILGLISFIVGVLYLINLKERISNENSDNRNLFDKSMIFQGFVGGAGLVIIGALMIYEELFKMF